MTATSEGEKSSAADAGASKVQAIRDGIDTVRSQASDAAHGAASAARDGLGQAKDSVAGVYEAGLDYAREAFSSVRDKAGDGVESSPLAALAAGIAIGAALGALLPRSEREQKALGPIGNRLNAVAREAVGAAKDAGQDKLAELGFSRDKARETVKALLDGALAAAASAGTAALDSAKQQKQGEA
jgi:ElaB/YqjD/DUF883 family membrane-anchored ribosome-binding protein